MRIYSTEWYKFIIIIMLLHHLAHHQNLIRFFHLLSFNCILWFIFILKSLMRFPNYTKASIHLLIIIIILKKISSFANFSSSFYSNSYFISISIFLNIYLVAEIWVLFTLSSLQNFYNKIRIYSAIADPFKSFGLIITFKFKIYLAIGAIIDPVYAQTLFSIFL